MDNQFKTYFPGKSGDEGDVIFDDEGDRTQKESDTW
jgi:hypothetical protein